MYWLISVIILTKLKLWIHCTDNTIDLVSIRYSIPFKNAWKFVVHFGKGQDTLAMVLAIV